MHMPSGADERIHDNPCSVFWGVFCTQVRVVKLNRQLFISYRPLTYLYHFTVALVGSHLIMRHTCHFGLICLVMKKENKRKNKLRCERKWETFTLRLSFITLFLPNCAVLNWAGKFLILEPFEWILAQNTQGFQTHQSHAAGCLSKSNNFFRKQRFKSKSKKTYLNLICPAY